MDTLNKAVFNWSGGKDSSLALYKLLRDKSFDVNTLITSISSTFRRVSMHGVREELLELQAASIGIPLQKIEVPDGASMESYNQIMSETMTALRQFGIQYSIFGDIFLEDLRKYREDQLAKVDMKAAFPLWDTDTRKLAEEFINEGFKAIIVCVNDRYLDKSFAGRLFDHQFLADLPAAVDPCGENGEFHSFVFDGPIFRDPVEFNIGETIYRSYATDSTGDDHAGYDTGFYYTDLLVNPLAKNI